VADEVGGALVLGQLGFVQLTYASLRSAEPFGFPLGFARGFGKTGRAHEGARSRTFLLDRFKTL
jgi:hypothetical protein